MFQDDGASTEVTGIFVSAMALMTAGNGSRTSPAKLKPRRGHQSTSGASHGLGKHTKDGIDDVVSRLESSGEVVDKGYL